MEYSPPPLFKQGASARAKVVFFSLIAIALLLVDSRLQSLVVIRQVIGTALYPLQQAALLPRNGAQGIVNYFYTLSSVERENKALRRQQAANAQTLQRAQQLFSENAQLRKLLGTSEQLPVKSIMSEILYDARDVFTRKIVLDRGTREGVAPGQPVIDDTGVVGQVTRVFPFTSEATLLTDKDQAIPVQVLRNGLRSIAYGRGQSGVLDLKFMAPNADIQKGDKVVTSGIDGVYPSGLSVATVTQVESKSNDAFARIVCQPSAGIDRNKQLLILLAQARAAPRLAPEPVKDKKDKTGKARAHDSSKAAAKEPVKSNAKDAPQNAPQGAAKERPQELPQDLPKNTPKRILKDAANAPPDAAAKAPGKSTPERATGAAKPPVRPASERAATAAPVPAPERGGLKGTASLPASNKDGTQ